MSLAIRCTRHRADLFSALHELTDSYKLALYTNAAAIGAASTEYTAADEVAGGTYPAGGFALAAPTLVGDVLTFPDCTVPAVTVPAFQKLLLYNATRGNAAICVIVLDNPASATGVDLIFDFPANLLSQAPDA